MNKISIDNFYEFTYSKRKHFIEFFFKNCYEQKLYNHKN